MKPIITAIVLMLLGAGLGLFLYAQVPTTVLTHLVAFGAGIAVGILMLCRELYDLHAIVKSLVWSSASCTSKSIASGTTSAAPS